MSLVYRQSLDILERYNQLFSQLATEFFLEQPQECLEFRERGGGRDLFKSPPSLEAKPCRNCQYLCHVFLLQAAIRRCAGMQRGITTPTGSSREVSKHYSYTVLQFCSYAVIQVQSYTVIPLYRSIVLYLCCYTVIHLYIYTCIKFYIYTGIQLYINTFIQVYSFTYKTVIQLYRYTGIQLYIYTLTQFYSNTSMQ